VSDVIIANNRCTGSASKTIWLASLESDSSLTRINCNGNIVVGGTHGIFISTSAPGATVDDINVSNNVVSGAAVAGFALTDYAPGQSTNVRFLGNSGSRPLLNSNGAPAVNACNSWNSAVGHSTAPPQTGTWEHGALIYNAAPSPGQPIGWVCTAGGAPGTWKRFGLISVDD
jgi:hypothetical protein